MSQPSISARWRRRGQWIAIGVALLAAGALLTALPVRQWIEALRGTVEGLGWWGPIIYAAVYAIGAVLVLPSGPFQVGAGLLFGLAVGIPTALAGTWLALAGAFAVGRWFARDRVQRLLEDRPRMRAVEGAIADGGWKTVVMLRLSPILPMSLHNYVYGLTRMKFRVYMPAAAIAVAPGTVMWAWIGAVGGSAATASGEASVVQWVLRGVGLVATVAVSILLARHARRRLEDEDTFSDEGQDADEASESADDEGEGEDAPSAPPAWQLAAWSLAATALTVCAVLGHIYDGKLEQWLGG